jgi:ABC-type polar amino acid transport system ATPase subunit
MNLAHQTLLRIDAVGKRFGQAQVLDGIQLSVALGDIISILGPSGSGKSTLLRCVALLENLSEGAIIFGGTTIASSAPDKTIRRSARKLRREIGMVFQSFNLWPHKTVLGNIIEAPMLVKGISRAEATEIAMALLHKVGLSEKRDAHPSQLSGGQQQRVAIARALAMSPKIMLFDEATSALDPELTQEVLNVIRILAGEGMTMLIVTHEMAFAKKVSSRIVFMDQGRIVEEGKPDAFFGSPQTTRARKFLESFQH